MGDFHDDLRVGQRGEAELQQMLERHPLTVRLQDARSEDAWRRRGVDYVWSRRRHLGIEEEIEQIEIEVKTEQRYTGKLFLETVSNCGTGKPGWFHTSTASFVASGFLDRRRWYVWSLAKMRHFVEGRALERRKAKTTGPTGSVLYETEGLLLPLDTQGLYDDILVATADGEWRNPENDATAARLLIHKNAPGWGMGRIVHLGATNVVCQFEGPGEKRLQILAVLAQGLLIWADDGAPLAEHDLLAL